jgi:hypothetical protein
MLSLFCFLYIFERAKVAANHGIRRVNPFSNEPILLSFAIVTQ